MLRLIQQRPKLASSLDQSVLPWPGEPLIEKQAQDFDLLTLAVPVVLILLEGIPAMLLGRDCPPRARAELAYAKFSSSGVGDLK